MHDPALELLLGEMQTLMGTPDMVCKRDNEERMILVPSSHYRSFSYRLRFCNAPREWVARPAVFLRSLIHSLFILPEARPSTTLLIPPFHLASSWLGAHHLTH